MSRITLSTGVVWPLLPLKGRNRNTVPQSGTCPKSPNTTRNFHDYRPISYVRRLTNLAGIRRKPPRNARSSRLGPTRHDRGAGEPAGQLTGQLGPRSRRAAGPPDRPGRWQDTGHHAPPHGRGGPGQVAGDAADDEDREHREQRPDAAANAQRPTARRVGPCHRTRAGEYEEPDRKAGRAERGRPVRHRRAPAPPGDERGREQGQQDGRRDGCRGRARDEQPGPAGGGHGPRGPWHCRRWAHGPDANSAARRASPDTAAILPTRKYDAAGPARHR